jgi:hypothetical protein
MVELTQTQPQTLRHSYRIVNSLGAELALAPCLHFSSRERSLSDALRSNLDVYRKWPAGSPGPSFAAGTPTEIEIITFR